MMVIEKWIVYAVFAALLWGASYAASGPVLRAGMSPLVFYFYYALLSLLTAIAMLLMRGKMDAVWGEVRHIGPYKGWFFFSLVAVAIGALMTYMAIGAKNATLACLIEVSYPFFVAIFSWFFFKDLQLNVMTLLGGVLVFSGVAVIVIFSK